MIRFDDYVIDADSQSVNAYRMSKSVSKKTGETTETQSLVGYYGTLEGAINGCRKDAIRRCIGADKVESLMSALLEVRDITRHFNDILEGVSQAERA